jgi:tetratricopeptide (TPR) repeat protein
MFRFIFTTSVSLSILLAQPGGGSPALRQASQLDVEGKYTEARALIQKEMDTAQNPRAKAQAQRVMAMSYAFESNCRKTIEYEQMVIDYWVTREKEEPANAFFQQGEMANEAARVCIDSGDLDAAERWYKKGTELGLKEPGISADRTALWKFRLAHAQARLAARRGKRAEATRYIDEARSHLEAMTDLKKQQEPFFPYLTGYVALYLGDHQQALADLEKANQSDAFIQCLIAMTHEKLGNKEKALEYWRKASQARAHNPPGAYAIPLARKKLG